MFQDAKDYVDLCARARCSALPHASSLTASDLRSWDTSSVGFLISPDALWGATRHMSNADIAASGGGALSLVNDPYSTDSNQICVATNDSSPVPWTSCF
jgi:hypothetical protein